MKDAITRFLRDDEGLTIVEYAVAAALITVAVVAAFGTLGEEVGKTIQKIIDELTGSGGGGGTPTGTP